ncbi:hypothetical protein ASF11_10015 [Acidovorax sp. Leaf76]|uniref:hypothetical protein n=1 Tax=unclassified Acidovorax TaxID=2684926 RepID=UPI0006F96819|nr:MULTISPECIES: hypothetical protein [unclassified Acidovorax]KQO16492.1 hypothetical protein ASF11_10015 [Acidovorax sp. Leaf76]KQO32559.1 hypothetical protein ASF19_08845 [Acidovorax sp. Leaf84]KQS32127.1 hypothetical protein ASG27_09135 [Acidovorax sp. Leaf191]
MLFPTDPTTRPGLMTETLSLLSSKPQIVAVLDGNAHENQIAALPDRTLAIELCRQFESASIKRVGSSRGAAIGPVWAFDTAEDSAELKLCTLPGAAGEPLDKARWANEVQTIVMNIEFEERAIRELRFPVRLEGIECQGWERRDDHKGSILRRRS